MRIAISTEVKNNELRVTITPVGIHGFVRRGHEVYIQADTGIGSPTPDEEFVAQGAKIVSNAADAWEVSGMVIKVKEPISSEYQYLREGLTLFTCLHLAADRPQTDVLLKAGTTAIACETVQLPSGALPLLYPVSGIAGSLAPQVGVHALMKAQEGRGVLMGCIGSVPSAKVVVLDGGVAGQSAANIAIGLDAGVTVPDTDLDRLHSTSWRFHNQVHGVASSVLTMQEHVLQADLVAGTVLIPDVKAPKLVTNDMVTEMKSGSVLVDVTIDQGNCFGDSHPTTYDDPTFSVRNSQLYCVTNMSGAVPGTPTWALTSATPPYTVQLTDKGATRALKDNSAPTKDLNAVRGNLTFAGVSETLNLPLMPLTEALNHIG